METEQKTNRHMRRLLRGAIRRAKRQAWRAAMRRGAGLHFKPVSQVKAEAKSARRAA